MSVTLSIHPDTPDFSRCRFTLSGAEKGLKVSFENATLNKSVAISQCSTTNDGISCQSAPKITGELDLSDPSLTKYSSISVYAKVFTEENGKTQVLSIAAITLSVPKALKTNPNFSVSVDPELIEYGQRATVNVRGTPSAIVYVSINNREEECRLTNEGLGSVSIDSASLTNRSNLVQHLRVFLSVSPSTELHDTGFVVMVLPESQARAAIASADVTTKTLDILSPTDINQVLYPEGGVPEIFGCAAQTQITRVYPITTQNSSSSSENAEFARIHSFSFAHTSQDTALVAISALDDVPNETLTDEADLARARAARVHILSTPVGSNYASPVRTGRVVNNTESYFDCSTGSVIEIDVDTDMWPDANLQFIWALDGSMAGVKYKILSRTSPDRWHVISLTADNVVTQIGDCFRFVAYGGPACIHTYPSDSLYAIQPLPYITDDGVAISASHPQIAVNDRTRPCGTLYGYVIAEAVIDGATQLFYYGFDVSTVGVYGWKQLTYDGENRNAKVVMDGDNNLHVVWESSRCKPGQIMYGMLGPGSRAMMNEALVSMVDKQACSDIFYGKEANTDGSDRSNSPTRLDTSLVDITEPLALDTRDIDEYGAKVSEDMWREFIYNSGSCTITDDGTISVSGNPKTKKFAAVASLIRDEFDNRIDGDFSQFSYQLSFDLLMTASPIIQSKTLEQIHTAFISWRANHFDAAPSSLNIPYNVYIGTNSNRYTIGEPEYIYDDIIPIAGSYRLPGIKVDDDYTNDHANEQARLRHFMLAIVPERSRFLATNIETSAQYTTRIGSGVNYLTSFETTSYTGRFKLALITETSANIGDERLGAQRYHIVKMFGEALDITEIHNYKIAVHYSRVREESVISRKEDSLDQPEQAYRFSGDIIVAVDDVVQGAESFIPDFADSYHQYDIGVGCPIIGEYHPRNLRPYDGTLNANIDVTLAYSRISIGPHSVVADPYVTHFAAADRNVSRMYIASRVDEYNSLTAAEEDFLTDADYLLTLGLKRGKVRLSQVPITFEGRNTSPSICLDVCDRLHITWQSNRNSNWEIYYTSSLNQSLPFRFDTRITRSLGHSIMPSIGVDNRGRRLIAWQDNRLGRYQIFAARSVAEHLCDRGRCQREWFEDEYGSGTPLNYYETYEYDGAPFEYDEFLGFEYDPYYDEYGYESGSVCRLRFTFKNTGTTAKKFHFIADFFTDAAQSDIHYSADSRMDIGSWYVRFDNPKRAGGLLAHYYSHNLPASNGVGDYFDTLYSVQVDSTLNYSGVGLIGVRWEGYVRADYTETYTISTVSDDGVRVWWDDVQKIDNWDDHSPETNSFNVDLVAGQYYKVRVDYYDSGTTGVCQLKWASTSVPEAVIPSGNLYYAPKEYTAFDYPDAIPLPYNGIEIDPNESVEIWYEVSKENRLSGRLYYVMITADNGTLMTSLEKQIVFYCPSEQMATCSVPCVYTNVTASDTLLHFRVRFYTDAAYTNQVLEADSSTDQRRWETGSNLLPSTGVTVKPGETVNMVYNPDFLPRELSAWQNFSTATALLCNAKYYVRIWQKIGGVYTLLSDQDIAIECICPDVDSNVWRKDEISAEWLSSGQGGMDLRVTDTQHNAVFPSVAASQDGRGYIVWEDHRHSTTNAITPSIYYAIWDANLDLLYSSAQGYWDTLLADQGYYRPIAIVNNLQHLTALYSNGIGLFRRTCSLARESQVSSSSSSSSPVDYLTFPGVLNYTQNDLTGGCLGISVYSEDIIDAFHADADTPIHLVDKCVVRLEITAPPHAYAVRFKNETDSSYSDWITVQPRFTMSSSSSSSFATSMQAYFISDNRFVSQWVLSAGSGNKTVSCEVMTLFGKMPALTLNIVARYRDVKYKVFFYRDSERTISASEYNGYPVISTRALFVENGKVTSIDEANTRDTTIYLKVVFEDPTYLESLLALNALDRFADISTLTFDAILPAQTINGTLTAQTATPLEFNFATGVPTTELETAVQPGTYHGEFEISEADGIDFVDGLAVIVVNIPTPCAISSSSSGCATNRTTVEDIQAQRASEVAAIEVDLEKFRQHYDRDLLCTFTSNQCVDGTEVNDDPFDDDETEPPDHTGPVSCETLTWSVPRRGEPCFFVRGGQNRRNWITYSPVFELDFSDERIDYLKFTSDSLLDGILWMIKPNDTILQSGEATCPTGCSNCGSNTRAVTFTVPQKSVVFNNDYLQDVRFLCHKATDCNFGSAKKSFSIFGSSIGIVAAGDGSNHGMDIAHGGDDFAWLLPVASGKNESPLLSSSSSGTNGSYQTDLTISVSRSELQRLGFLRSNGVLQFRFAYITSGVGSVNLGFTCGVSCEE